LWIELSGALRVCFNDADTENSPSELSRSPQAFKVAEPMRRPGPLPNGSNGLTLIWMAVACNVQASMRDTSAALTDSCGTSRIPLDEQGRDPLQ
jgi:hypothetical protein